MEFEGKIIWWVFAFVVAVLAVGKWVGHVNSDRSKFNEFMKEVRDDIKTILTRLPLLIQHQVRAL